VVWLLALAPMACAGPGEIAEPAAPDLQPIEAPPPEDWTATAQTAPPVGPAVNSARSASLLVQTMPVLDDPAAAREIALHAALFRAAYQSNVGDFTRHFLLDPPSVADPLPLAIDEGEIRVRVLAALVDLGVPVAWAGDTRSDPDAFPGTSHLATHLRFRIERRSEGGLEVRAEVMDRTLHVGSSRQRITATWSERDRLWSIRRDPARLIY
jgi:hypothetical protein